ncbi:MAG: hypothetical protein HOM80_04360 [Bacteroidetes bacterium]|nr:hypothetical protein [Bacteroidota bacterium]
MNLLESDLYLISRFVFANPKEVFVLDPGNVCISNVKTGLHFVRQRKEVESLAKLNKSYFLINISGASTFSFPIDFSKVETLISFNKKVETSTDFYHTQLHYHTDDSGRLKWILSEKYTRGDFLSDTDENKTLVDVNNFFSVFPFLINFIRLKLGFIGSVAKGRMQVLLKERYLFSFLENKQYESFSVNIRPSFSSGVILAKYYTNNKWIFSAKRGFNVKGRKKLANEHAILQNLNSKRFEHLEVPVSKEYPDGMLLTYKSTFKQMGYFGIQKLINERFNKAVFEYIQLKQDEQEIKSLIKDSRIPEILDHLKTIIEKKKFPRGLSIINYVKVFKELVLVLNGLDMKQTVPTSLVNVDLTPSNIAYTKERIHLLKWENADPKYPILFDLFEYSFAYIEDFDSPDIEYLTNDLDALRNSEQVEKLIEKTGLDFNLQLSLFALLRFSPEMLLFLDKAVLPPERNIKLYIWAAFFENLNAKKNSLLIS